MSTFDSTKISLEDLLKGVCAGKIQLPDFQRGWVWDDDHIRGLLVSIARSFPIGAVMLLETGGDVKFQARLVEGVESILGKGVSPEKLILDGQQRLTTLTQALMLPDMPVQTRTSKGKNIQRHYYFDVKSALGSPADLTSAIKATDETCKVRGNFGRDVTLDLSSRELECKHLHFPCDQVMDSDEWEDTLDSVAPDNSRQFREFRKKVLKSFRKYDLPVIELKKRHPKRPSAWCLKR